MKRLISHRAASLTAVAALAIASSAAAWIEVDAASGSQPSAGGSSLTFSLPVVSINCSANSEQVSLETFIETPDGTVQRGGIGSITCQGTTSFSTSPITVSAAPAGTYEIGMEASTSGTVAFTESFDPEVTNSNGVVVWAPASAGPGQVAQHVQNISTFVYNAKLFSVPS